MLVFMQVLALATSAAMLAKVGVDLLKLAGLRRTRWYVPLALLLGVLATAGLMELSGPGGGLEWTRRTLVEALLAGVLAGASAAGVTELQKLAETAKRGRFGEKSVGQ